MHKVATLGISSTLTKKVIRREDDTRISTLIKRLTDPDDPNIPNFLRQYRINNLVNIMRGWRKVRIADDFGIPTMIGMVYAKVFKANGDVIDYGLVSCRVVTTAGVNYIVDRFQAATGMDLFKYHGIGTGTNAEAAGDTALQTELTTQYIVNSTRATGSLTEGASANIFRTVGTNEVDASVAITEHGVFTDAAVGSGTLLDRSVFSAINLVSSDQLQTTYDLTLTAGS